MFSEHKELGIWLGVDHNRLKAIDNEHKNVVDKVYEVLQVLAVRCCKHNEQAAVKK